MALSAVIIVAGIVTLVTRGMPLGVEFAGGTAIIVQFDSGVRGAGARSARPELSGRRAEHRRADVRRSVASAG